MVDQVICIESTVFHSPDIMAGDRAVKGQVYTIKQELQDMNGFRCYLLNEIRFKVDLGDKVNEGGYNVEDFRPVNDESLDVFRKLVQPVKEDV